MFIDCCRYRYRYGYRPPLNLKRIELYGEEEPRFALLDAKEKRCGEYSVSRVQIAGKHDIIDSVSGGGCGARRFVIFAYE